MLLVNHQFVLVLQKGFQESTKWSWVQIVQLDIMDSGTDAENFLLG
jgi:hypothetical protein